MRIVILSNRLKVTVVEEGKDITVIPSSGGLITSLGSYLETLRNDEYTWIGWPGNSNYVAKDKIAKELRSKYNSIPVFVDEEKMNLFYNGFCNKTLWPLFHYFPSFAEFDEKNWEEYQEVNAMFADEVIKNLEPSDVLWIHDYHFMLVPRLVREKRNDIAIGFFLHIPFPSYEIFRLLPSKWGKEILKGMLDADLIGFHTYDYTQYFLRCVLRILGFNNNIGLIALNRKLTKVGTFPLGIDFNKYYDAVVSHPVERVKTSIQSEVHDLKVIFSVDRQDYTKGILNRLKGYELFLNKYPEWHQKVILIMVVVPSRIGIDDYESSYNTINQLISRINGLFGNVHWTPIIYQYKPIPFEQLITYYNISDVGLVTPLRDGMNLVAKEFVTAQRDHSGVLILSEMAGAAMELSEALIINPNYAEEISDAIHEALIMPEEEKSRRIKAMQERIKNNDVKSWALNFIHETLMIKAEQSKYGTIPLESKGIDAILTKFWNAGRRILFLDYDGTLVPFAANPAGAVPGKRLLGILKDLSQIPGTSLVIISGRSRRELQHWYSKHYITLVAEHGVWIRRPGEEWEMTKHLNNDWKPRIIEVMENFKARLPHSMIEEKEYGVAWHFRNSDDAISKLRVKEFVDTMVHLTAPNDIEVLSGNKVVEIKCAGVSKGETARRIIDNQEYDFILAAGDDLTDESLFQALPDGAVSIKIGKTNSFAGYYLESSNDLINILERLTSHKKDMFLKLKEIIKRKPFAM